MRDLSFLKFSRLPINPLTPNLSPNLSPNLNPNLTPNLSPNLKNHKVRAKKKKL